MIYRALVSHGLSLNLTYYDKYINLFKIIYIFICIFTIHTPFSKGIARALTSELGPVQYIASIIAGCTITADFRKLQSVAGENHFNQRYTRETRVSI